MRLPSQSPPPAGPASATKPDAAQKASPPRADTVTESIVHECADYQQLLTLLKGGESQTDQSSVYLALFSLNGLNPTVSDLNSSRIHLYLAQNVAKRSGVTGELARQLVAKWRRMLPSQSPPPAGPASATKPDAAQKASPSSSQSPPAPQAEPSMQQISSKKPLSTSIVNSGPLSESASKKAKTCSKSPPPSASKSPPPHPQMLREWRL
jgi:hypothetical protein